MIADGVAAQIEIITEIGDGWGIVCVDAIENGFCFRPFELLNGIDLCGGRIVVALASGFVGGE